MVSLPFRIEDDDSNRTQHISQFKFVINKNWRRFYGEKILKRNEEDIWVERNVSNLQRLGSCLVGNFQIFDGNE